MSGPQKSSMQFVNSPIALPSRPARFDITPRSAFTCMWAATAGRPAFIARSWPMPSFSNARGQPASSAPDESEQILLAGHCLFWNHEMGLCSKPSRGPVNREQLLVVFAHTQQAWTGPQHLPAGADRPISRQRRRNGGMVRSQSQQQLDINIVRLLFTGGEP